jgi:hypothetical protein
MNGNIFGGFTPVKWESSAAGCVKGDDSLKSFLFTLKNPHNIPARRFALKAGRKHEAIKCVPNYGSCFGLYDLCISDDCNTNTWSNTWLDNTYANDSGIGHHIVLTGGRHFQVKEIEVFEITA